MTEIRRGRCPKCAGLKREIVYMRRFVWPPPHDAGPYSRPIPRDLCRTDACPDGEHLHLRCACGYWWPSAVAGVELGTPVAWADRPAYMQPAPPRRRLRGVLETLRARVRTWWLDRVAEGDRPGAHRGYQPTATGRIPRPPRGGTAAVMPRSLGAGGDRDEICADPGCGKPRFEHGGRGHAFRRRAVE